MCCLFICLSMGNAFAQGRTIGGKVIDSNGQPIIGAGVTIPGTTVGVATDLDGTFRITLPDETTAVTVSALGYTSKE